MSEKRRVEEAYARAEQQAERAEQASATDDSSIEVDESLEESEEPNQGARRTSAAGDGGFWPREAGARSGVGESGAPIAVIRRLCAAMATT